MTMANAANSAERLFANAALNIIIAVAGVIAYIPLK